MITRFRQSIPVLRLVLTILCLLVTASCNSEGSYEQDIYSSRATKEVELDAYPIENHLRATAESDVRAYVEALAKEDLDKESRARVENLLAESQTKEAMLSAPTPTEKEYAEVRDSHATQVASELPYPTEEIELGILESGIYFEVHLPSTVKVSNIWQGYVDGNLTRIYAGSLRRDTSQDTSIVKDESTFGAVYVMSQNRDGSITTNTYSTELETGSLRIKDASENYLVLESDGGRLKQTEIMFFGLSQQRLVDSVEKLSINTIEVEKQDTSGYP